MNDDVVAGAVAVMSAFAVHDERGRWREEAGRAQHGTLADAGWDRVGLDEALGGPGGDDSDALAIAYSNGLSGVPTALPEVTGLSMWLFNQARLAPEAAWLVPIAVPAMASERDGLVSVSAARVPWARWASHFVIPCADAGGRAGVAVVPAEAATVIPGNNMAGEPRDSVVVDAVSWQAHALLNRSAAEVELAVRLRGGWLRAAQIAGATQTMQRLAVRYSGQRTQFGRPIAQFQAVQQLLATLAAEAAAARAAAELTNGHVDERWQQAAALAKIRAGQAGGAAALAAHQVHGALGVTMEHPLQRSTRAVWAWRDEFGGEAHWHEWLAGRLGRGADFAVWPWVTAMRP